MVKLFIVEHIIFIFYLFSELAVLPAGGAVPAHRGRGARSRRAGSGRACLASALQRGRHAHRDSGRVQARRAEGAGRC